MWRLAGGVPPPATPLLRFSLGQKRTNCCQNGELKSDSSRSLREKRRIEIEFCAVENENELEIENEIENEFENENEIEIENEIENEKRNEIENEFENVFWDTLVSPIDFTGTY